MVSSTNCCVIILILSTLLLLCSSALVKLNDKTKKAINETADTLTGAIKKTENHQNNFHKQLENTHFLENQALASLLAFHGSGNKEIKIQSAQGYDDDRSYQPPSLTIKQMSTGDSNGKKDASSDEKGGKTIPYYYPHGLGPVLFNGCTGESYGKTSPCFNSKQFFLQKAQCYNQIDAANFIGVGFNGRGFFSSESRRSSLVQRICSAASYFLNSQVPDNMNCYGIYDTHVSTKAYQSLDDYMKHLRQVAGVSDSSSMFQSEEERMTKSYSTGIDFGSTGAFIGAAAGMYNGGAEGGAAGAKVGAALGGLIGTGSGTSNGKSESTQKGKASASFKQQVNDQQQLETSKNFIAIMSVDILLFEIALDEVTPEALSFAFVKDYMDLPRSYNAIGAVGKYQSFLIRWGTHYIRSAKMGGQLRITKTSKSSRKMTGDEFSSIAQTEFQAMFANLKQSYN